MSEVAHNTQRGNGLRIVRGVGYVLLTIVTFVIVAISMFNLLYIQTIVSGTSMQPKFYEGDVAFVNRFLQGDKGDILVAEVPWGIDGEKVSVIKRYVAGEGDRVKFVKVSATEIYLYVNGEKVVEPYVSGGQSMAYLEWTLFLEDNALTNNFEIDAEGYLVIPDNYVYLLGDNREESSDCSRYGPISRDNVIGKVDYVVKKGENVKGFIFNIIFNILRV